MNVGVLQFTSSIIIFSVLITAGLLPFCILRSRPANDRKSKKKLTCLSLSNCFATGVFICTCFMGLMPHVRKLELELKVWVQKLDTNTTASEFLVKIDNFPQTELMIIIGFLIILIVEQLVHFCHQHPVRITKKGHNPDIEELPLVANGVELVEDDEMSHSSENHSHHVVLNHGKRLDFQSLVLLFGLGTHSIMEGLAMGLQTERETFLNLFVAVLLHEILCALSFGLALASQKAPCGSGFLSIVFLSVTIPLGMCLGFVIPKEPSLVMIGLRFVLEGLAAGTFVYVACVEMLASELSHSHGAQGGKAALMKAMFVCIGVLIYVIFAIITA